MRNRNTHRRGFILAEALVALTVLAVIFIALEGSLAMVLRSLAESDRESVAARIAEAQRERAFATPCTTGSGVDSTNGVRVEWQAAPSGTNIHIAQSSHFATRAGDHAEFYDVTGSCR